MKITLKRTKNGRSDRMASGRVCYFPASYDIYADGKKVGEMWGVSNTRIVDGGHCHHASVNGVNLRDAAFRGRERERMEAEIREILSKKAN